MGWKPDPKVAASGKTAKQHADEQKFQAFYDGKSIKAARKQAGKAYTAAVKGGAKKK